MFRSLLFLFLILSTAVTEAKEPQLLATHSKLVAEYCRTEIDRYDCMIPNRKKMLRVYLPDRMVEVIGAHVNSAFQQKFFDEISRMDLFHGHFILDRFQEKFDRSENLFAEFSTLLYHSAERTSRWFHEGRAGVPPLTRRQRSFVGAIDQVFVKPAIQLMDPNLPLKKYQDAGTVFTDEIVKSLFPEKAGDYDTYGSFKKEITLHSCTDEYCGLCEVSPMVILAHEEGGRLTSPAGQSYEAYIRCSIDERALN